MGGRLLRFPRCRYNCVEEELGDISGTNANWMTMSQYISSKRGGSFMKCFWAAKK